MKTIIGIIITLIIAILLISSAYIIFFTDTEEDDIILDDEENNEDGDEGSNGDETDDGVNTDDVDDGGDQQEYLHTVFIEDGTAGWCSDCPVIAEIIYELYESQKYRFYYVSLVDDGNSKAQQRLEEEYNIYGFPTVYIDGGYGVVVEKQSKSVYEEKISAAESRVTPKIKLEEKAFKQFME